MPYQNPFDPDDPRWQPFEDERTLLLERVKGLDTDLATLGLALQRTSLTAVEDRTGTVRPVLVVVARLSNQTFGKVDGG